ncbi:MAG: 50S ribosomal protein L25 [Ktedonobacterales bacterium]
MTERAILQAERREKLGKAVKILRRQGLIPGNLYGKGKASQPLQMNAHDLTKFIAAHGPATLVELHLDGNKRGETVMVQQIQRESVSHAIQHVDFLHIQMSKPFRLHIPIHIEGEAPAVKRDGGVLLHILESVEVEALPAKLPEALSLNISDMEELKSIRHVSDLQLPPDVTLLTPPDEVVVKIEQPRTLEVPVEPAAAEPAAAEPESQSAGSPVEE